MNAIPKQAQTVLFVGAAGIAVFFIATKVVGGTLGAAAETIGNTVKDTLQSVNPVNNDNIFSRAADSVVSVFSDGDASIGSLLFDLFNPAADVAVDTPENNLNATVRKDPNIFLLDPFGASVSDQLRAAGLLPVA